MTDDQQFSDIAQNPEDYSLIKALLDDIVGENGLDVSEFVDQLSGTNNLDTNKLPLSNFLKEKIEQIGLLSVQSAIHDGLITRQEALSLMGAVGNADNDGTIISPSNYEDAYNIATEHGIQDQETITGLAMLETISEQALKEDAELGNRSDLNQLFNDFSSDPLLTPPPEPPPEAPPATPEIVPIPGQDI